MIKQAAIQIEKQIYTLPRPARHNDIIAYLIKLGFPKQVRNLGIQGFITHKNVFVNREEASEIALKNMQCFSLIAPPNLYSEDLW